MRATLSHQWRHADADFSRLVESIEDYAIFMLDPAGIVLSWNRGAEHIKGYARDEIVGRHFSRFYTDEDLFADKPARELVKAARVGRFEDEGWRVRADGSRFWANVVITAVRDPAGNLCGFAKVTRDLTQRREAERRLLGEQIARAEAEARSRRLTAIQSITDVSLGDLAPPQLLRELVARVRAQLTVDVAAIQLLDLEKQDLVLVAASGARAYPENERVPLGRGVTGRVAATREPLVVPDVSAVEVASAMLRETIRSYAGVPLIAAGQVLGVLSVGTRAPHEFSDEDVMLLRLVADRAAAAIERSRTHAALAESERQFRATFEQAAVGVAHVGLDGRWLRVNRKLCAIVGYSEEELLRMRFQDITHPDDLQADLDRFVRLWAGEIDTYAKEKRYVHRDGHSMWIQLTVSLVRDDDGMPVYTIAVVEDISARKRVEEERDRLLVELREALSARDRFLSVASHELKTPLTTLTLQTQWLAHPPASADEPPLSPRQRARLGSMARQVDRLAALVDQLLDVTRVHEGRLVLQEEEVDLGELACEIAERFEDEAARAAAPIDVDVHEHAIGCWDRLRLDQVLTNLVSNAIKYGRGQPVSVSVSADAERARVVVADRGIGIRAEDQARLFGRFERLVSDKAFGGLGLGLWITREIVRAHGGTIRVESTPGQGATFVVELPRNGPPGADARPSART